jgi:hypothetical protein
MKKASLIVVCLGIGAMLSWSVSRSQQPSTHDDPQQLAMTGQQKEHSRLYQSYKGIGDLRRLAEESTGDVEVLTGAGQQIFYSQGGPTDSETFLNREGAKADAVVMGTVKSQQSFLTAEGTFVFTDYDFVVDEVLKNNAILPLVSSETIVVTRPGGSLQLAGHTVRALDESLQPLEKAHSYLLFLNYISATGGYEAFNPHGSFKINLNRAIKLTSEHLPAQLESGFDVSFARTSLRKR